MRALGVLLGCVLLALAAGAAEPALPPARTPAEIDARLDALTKRQIEEAATIRDQIRACNELWKDSRFSSPEIDELRRKIEALTRETAEFQAVLRKRVADLPAARAEIERMEQARKAYEAIGREIEELKERRRHVF